MTNLENSIKDVITKKMEDGTIEQLIAEQLEKGVKNALDSLFRSYGDVTKVIEEKVKSVMIPYLEKYDYSEYIVKLDSVLVDVLKGSALENKKMLENFKELMITEEEPRKTIKVSELFERWMKHVAEEVDTSDLEVCYEDGVSYEDVDVSFEVEYEEGRSWSDFEYATIYFECKQDEELNFALKIHRWEKYDKEFWTIDYDKSHELKSLRQLSKFEIYLMKLNQDYVKLEIDSDGDSDYVTPEKEPEPSFS